MPKLGEMLVEEGYITEKLLQELLTRQVHYSGRLGRTLVETGFLEEYELLSMLSRQFGVSAVDLDGLNISQRTIESVRREVAAKLFFMPFHRTEAPGVVLSIAVPNPTNQELMDKIRYATKCDVRPYVATETAILRALERYYGIKESELGDAYEGYSAASLSVGERAIWRQEGRKMLRARRMDQLIEAALVELLIEKGYFTREEYEARLQGTQSS